LISSRGSSRRKVEDDGLGSLDSKSQGNCSSKYVFHFDWCGLTEKVSCEPVSEQRATASR
jgi:hypothetical protein